MTDTAIEGRLFHLSKNMSRFAYEKKLGSLELDEPKEIIARLIQYPDQQEKSLDLRLFVAGDFSRYTKAGLTIPVGLLPAFFDFIDGIKMSLNETMLKGDKNGQKSGTTQEIFFR